MTTRCRPPAPAGSGVLRSMIVLGAATAVPVCPIARRCGRAAPAATTPRAARPRGRESFPRLPSVRYCRPPMAAGSVAPAGRYTAGLTALLLALLAAPGVARAQDQPADAAKPAQAAQPTEAAAAAPAE